MTKDLTGQVFGYWTVIDSSNERYQGSAKWLCRCKCGTTKLVNGSSLRNNTSTSCGCKQRESVRTHGLSYSLTYESWHSMQQRCGNINAGNFHKYGAKGITIINSWKKFENFLADMGERPGKEWSLDRIDSNKGYCPENCRWVTGNIQNQNRRGNKYVVVNNTKMCLAEYARLANISHSTATRLYNRNKLPVGVVKYG